jgi:DNA-binding CsgD family transcriptional regulator
MFRYFYKLLQRIKSFYLREIKKEAKRLKAHPKALPPENVFIWDVQYVPIQKPKEEAKKPKAPYRIKINNRVFTLEKFQKLKNDYPENYYTRKQKEEIGKIFGCSGSTIDCYLRLDDFFERVPAIYNKGIIPFSAQVSKRQFSKKDFLRIKQMVREGISTREIAKHFGASMDIVKKYSNMRNYNQRVRPPRYS